MYGLSADIKLGFLCGRELVQIAVGQFQLILKFDADISISVEGDFDHMRNGKSQLEAESLPEAAASLLRLLGANITHVENRGIGDIYMHFSTGEVVSVSDSNSDTESYEILGPGVHIIV
jgi:hypothetical protein